MTETMDLFEGIDLTKASLVKSRRDFLDHSILTGDRLVIQQHDPEAGALVVAVVDGKATVTRYEPAAGVSVLGVVVGVVRRLG